MSPTIVHVTTVPQSLIFLRGQLPYMKHQGFTLHAMSSPGPGLTDFGRTHDVPVHPVNMPRKISPGADLIALKEMVARLRAISPDLVHAHTPKGGLLGMIAATAAGVPRRVYHMRGLPLMTATGVKRQLLTWTERVSCALAHEVICVSPSLRDEAIALGLAPKDKLHVMANGSGNGVDAAARFDPSQVPKGTRDAVRAAHGIPDDALVVGFVGRLVRDKGVVELARAWKKVRRRIPEAHLLVVGPFEQRDAVPEDVVQTLQHDPSVHLIGFQQDTAACYAAMDVVTLPTYREGFPNVPMEAASMGLPVVATRVTGCVDAVVDGQTGALVEAGDEDALADALCMYLTSAALRDDHGRAGRARMLKDFQPQGIWHDIHALYVDLLER